MFGWYFGFCPGWESYKQHADDLLLGIVEEYNTFRKKTKLNKICNLKIRFWEKQHNKENKTINLILWNVLETVQYLHFALQLLLLENNKNPYSAMFTFKILELGIFKFTYISLSIFKKNKCLNKINQVNEFVYKQICECFQY